MTGVIYLSSSSSAPCSASSRAASTTTSRSPASSGTSSTWCGSSSSRSCIWSPTPGAANRRPWPRTSTAKSTDEFSSSCSSSRSSRSPSTWAFPENAALRRAGGLALVEATCVGLFFMHLKYESQHPAAERRHPYVDPRVLRPHPHRERGVEAASVVRLARAACHSSGARLFRLLCAARRRACPSCTTPRGSADPLLLGAMSTSPARWSFASCEGRGRARPRDQGAARTTPQRSIRRRTPRRPEPETNFAHLIETESIGMDSPGSSARVSAGEWGLRPALPARPKTAGAPAIDVSTHGHYIDWSSKSRCLRRTPLHHHGDLGMVSVACVSPTTRSMRPNTTTARPQT